MNLNALIRVGQATLVVMTAAVCFSATSASAGTCQCKIMNLDRCGGTGPTLIYRDVWSKPDRGSQWFFAGLADDPDVCMVHENAFYWGPAFNYYGYVVHGCNLLAHDCQYFD